MPLPFVLPPRITGKPLPPGAQQLTLQQQAEQVAASMIDPQVAAINRAIQQKQQGMGGEAQGYAGVINALSGLTAGIPESVRSAYQTSGDRIAGYAGSLTGTIGDAAKAAAAAAAQHLASLGAPGTVDSVAPAAMNVANYLGGTLPATSLASEAASRLAEAESNRVASGYALGQQALQALGATKQEISDLQAKGLDIQNTRPGEVQKALLTLRDDARQQQAADLAEKNFKLQARAEGVQESQLNRAWLQTLNSEAFNRTNATGTLWVVKGNRIIDTGQAAPGSAAGRAATSAATAAAAERGRGKRAQLSADVQRERNRETQAHNRVMEGISNAQLGISGKQADTAVKREQAYERSVAGKTKGKAGLAGMKESDIRQYGSDAGKYAYTFFNGQRNPKWDPAKGGGPGQAPVPGNPYYTTPPGSAADAMRYMLAKQIPYSIAWNAIYQYAKQKDSHWADALDWNPKYKPAGQKPKKKR